MSGFTSYLASSFSAAVALTVIACSAAPDDGGSSESSAATAAPNLCVGQAGNTFHCLDSTRFELCTGFRDQFVIESCPPGLCVTQSPANGNPCVGKARTPPGGGSGGGGGATGSSSSSSSGGVSSSSSGGVSGSSGAGGNGTTCVGGPKFDPAGAKNVGNGAGKQFIGGQCLDAADCASGCCAKPCGICSGPGAQLQAGKQGCGFGG